MRVVGIHGVGQQRFTADELTQVWSSALRAGLVAAGGNGADVDFSLVYYADLIERRRREWKGADDRPIDPDSEPEVAELLRAWAQPLVPGNGKGSTGVPATPVPVQRAVQWLASSPGLQGLGVAGVRRLARHLHAYLAYPEARVALWERVSAVVDRASGPMVLLGHSMGSVVAYEWSLRVASCRVGLVTIGSPLGAAPVRSRLGGEPSFPAACVRWVNVAGRYDPIAWPKELAPLFGAGVEDREMEPRVWAHRSRTYLRSPVVGVALLDAAA